MYPERLARPELMNGEFVRIADVHLDVPLYWQCWKLDSVRIKALTDAVRSAAADLYAPNG
jgi:LysR family transcriptional regulator (chromosome initiation inhibitor)